MKKFWAVLVVTCLSMPVWAASNCQTRVDQNINKSTSEKIRQCLMDETEVKDTTPGPEVVLTQTYSVHAPKAKEKPAQKQPKEQKVYSKQTHQYEYLDRTTYPSFRNDTLPLINETIAHDTAIEALREQRGEVGYVKPAVYKTVKSSTKTSVKTVKPGRQVQQTSSTVTITEQTTTQTPPAEIQQAKQLENDPLENLAPAEFEEDGVMGPAGFGYNATDPAMQQ